MRHGADVSRKTADGRTALELAAAAAARHEQKGGGSFDFPDLARPARKYAAAAAAKSSSSAGAAAKTAARAAVKAGAAAKAGATVKPGAQAGTTPETETESTSTSTAAAAEEASATVNADELSPAHVPPFVLPIEREHPEAAASFGDRPDLPRFLVDVEATTAWIRSLNLK